MSIGITVIAKDQDRERHLAEELVRAVDPWMEVSAGLGSDRGVTGQVVFVDALTPDLEGALGRLDRRGRAVFLIVGESALLPESLRTGAVDDALVHPFRPLEVLSCLRHFQQIM